MEYDLKELKLRKKRKGGRKERERERGKGREEGEVRRGREIGRRRRGRTREWVCQSVNSSLCQSEPPTQFVVISEEKKLFFQTF